MDERELFNEGLNKGMELMTTTWFKVLIMNFKIPADVCSIISEMVKWKIKKDDDIERSINNYFQNRS